MLKPDLLTIVGLALVSTPMAQAQFGAPERIDTSIPWVQGAVAGDVDGDGDLDVVSISSSLRAALWFENQGGGTFGPLHEIARFELDVTGLDVGDFDGDGIDDLVVVSSIGGPATVQLVLSLGDGRFAAAVPVVSANHGVGPRVRFLDPDQDGDLDIVIPNNIFNSWGTQVRFVENVGGVPAAARPLFQDLHPASSVEFADFDGDGDLDLALGSRASPHAWYRNDQGTYVLAQVLATPLVTAAGEVQAADFDGDGDQDLVYKFLTDLMFYENTDGAGTFTQVTIARHAGSEFVLVDVDLDGDIDVVVGGGAALTAPAYFENLGGFQFADDQPLVAGELDATKTLSVADITGDGLPDLLVASAIGRVTMIRGRSVPPGLAFEATFENIAFTAPRAVDIEPVDLDGDGDLDVVAASRTAGVLVALNRGAERFDPPLRTASAVGAAVRVRAGDLTGDGVPDIVVRDVESRLLWSQGIGDGSFGTPVIIDDLGTPSQVFGPLLVDLDADGDLDILGVPAPGTHVTAWDQTAPGVFGPRRTLATINANGMLLATGDIDGDGLIDIASAATTNGQQIRLRWYRGTGGGSFTQMPTFEVRPGIPRSLDLVDVDADGDLDLVWTNLVQRLVECAENVGTAPFAPIVALAPSIPNNSRLAVGDVDGDGLPDLVLAGAIGWPPYIAQWYAGTGGLGFVGPLPITDELTDIRAVRLADLDQDGDVDILFASALDGRLAWSRNPAAAAPGTEYCTPAAQNSAGFRARITTVGSRVAVDNELQLRGVDLPANVLGVFLVGRMPGVLANPGGSAGTLCLSGAIGPFVGAGQVQRSDHDGSLRLDIDLTSLPLPTGSQPALAGERWHFQVWYRDRTTGAGGSNFSSAVAVAFL